MISDVELIERFSLRPHPEGGFFRETFRDTLEVTVSPSEFDSGASQHTRSAATAIYYLLRQGDRSRFHRLRFCEVWHFYLGGPLEIWMLAKGTATSVRLGPNFIGGERLQVMIPAGCWFAAAPVSTAAYSFVGCTVAPGFEFSDFELASQDGLIRQFPEHRSLICRFT